jgi:hypothetical protein
MIAAVVLTKRVLGCCCNSICVLAASAVSDEKFVFNFISIVAVVFLSDIATAACFC